MGSVATRETFDEPIIEMNTTPLIDVMLVLLIMFIITIPLQTHAVKIDLPTDGLVVDSVKNKVAIDAAGTVAWNGQAVDLETLSRLTEQSAAMRPAPELHLQPAPAARYERVDEVLAVTKRAGVRNMGIVGNEQYRKF